MILGWQHEGLSLPFCTITFHPISRNPGQQNSSNIRHSILFSLLIVKTVIRSGFCTSDTFVQTRKIKRCLASMAPAPALHQTIHNRAVCHAIVASPPGTSINDRPATTVPFHLLQLQNHLCNCRRSSSSSSSAMQALMMAPATAYITLLLLITLKATQHCQCRAALKPNSYFYETQEIHEFLDPQNKARVSVGLEPLQWDSSLASYAQWWASQRQRYGRCLLRHSGGPYGENIFWGEAGRNWGPSDAVYLWVRERQWYDYKSNSCGYQEMCGHYTQIVWRNTKLVGCAKAVCADGDVFITCNYFPPGNYLGQRPF